MIRNQSRCHCGIKRRCVGMLARLKDSRMTTGLINRTDNPQIFNSKVQIQQQQQVLLIQK